MSLVRCAFPAQVASAGSYFRADYGIAGSTSPTVNDLSQAEALLWRVPLDEGHSTPVLGNGKIFLTTWRAQTRELATVALDQNTGKLLWRDKLSPNKVEQTHELGSPATATPACDGKRVFTFFGSAGLFCHDLDGRKLWEQKLGPFLDEYGAGSSPIVCDGKVILNQDHDIDSFLMAVDAATGRVLWKTPRPDAVRSYSTPAVWKHNGKTELLVAGALRLTAYSPETGEALWWLDGLARIVIPTPVPAGDVIYMASWAPGGDLGRRISFLTWDAALAKWDNNKDGKLAKSEIDDREVLERFFRMDTDQNGYLDQREWDRQAAVFRLAQNAILAIKPSGRGQLSETSVLWKYSKGVPYVATPVVNDGIVWMVKDGGIVTKLDAADGHLLQEERVGGLGNYFASPIAGDGKVYFCSEPGVVSLVSAETNWRLLSSRDFHEKIYATPVLAYGRLYLRTEQALYCFQKPQP